MQFLIIFSILCAGTYATHLDLGVECGLGTRLNYSQRIIGGGPAKKKDWGWQVAIRDGFPLVCGGFLINANWVLTAGHCVDGYENPKDYQVDIGWQNQWLPDSWSISRKVSKIIKHPGYEGYNLYNDLAMFKLTEPVPTDNVEYKIIPACISDGSEDYEGELGWATGYGTVKPGGGRTNYEMKQVDLPFLSDNRCLAKFSRYNSDLQLCAGEVGGYKDTCQGDSGGPLNVRGKDGRWHVVGLTSYGYTCGDGGVFTKLSYHNDWIKAIIESE